jgi:hypothetical protein
MNINYQKRKNVNLFNKFQSHPSLKLTNIQNYIPIYDRFFALNNTNYNSVNLNHTWYVSDIKENNSQEKHIYTAKLKHISNDDDLQMTQKIFIKLAPLLDPFKYLVGKYNPDDVNLFNLPLFHENTRVQPKITDHNNSSYVDGFFSFLTSKLLNEYKFIHGIDYYGSFLAIKNNYHLNVIDDIDYLIKSDFFIKKKGTLFEIEDYSHLLSLDVENEKRKPIQIFNLSQKSNLSIKSIDHSLFENIFENIFENETNTNEHLNLDDLKNNSIDLVDITNSAFFQINEKGLSTTLKSGSSCSSRSSYTNENITSENVSVHSDTSQNNTEETNDSYTEETLSTLEEETLYATLHKFPVQVICMENCENTLDDYIIHNEISTEEWFSIFMQIIMILITYQKLFSFTHNDLHTNNIMYISTSQPFIYYLYKNKYYKVPTFGKIYKIIDFGRAIYKLNGKTFCSDSFKLGGDAATQYNTEPYFNENKPRLEPNFSFDLCRLACSIFDYMIEDINDVKTLSQSDQVIKLIVEWCIDDNGVNVLYKNNGQERYPDFKLYKMIARCVHNHTPQLQLERPEFNKFVIPKNNLPKNANVIDIDGFKTMS